MHSRHTTLPRLGATLSILALTGVLAMSTPASALAAAPAASGLTEAALTDEEAESLQALIQEEKLAHDLYLALGEAWGLPVFQNIAESEARHQQALAELLDVYDVANPVTGLASGAFADPKLQTLYDELLARGRTSVEEALGVAALVEETDIQDPQQVLQTTHQPEVQRVYENLLQGSIRHLGIFTSQWERETGATYEPQVIPAEAYTALVQDSLGPNGDGAGRGAAGPQGRGSRRDAAFGRGPGAAGPRGDR